MSEKKKFGRFLALATASGAVAAGVSYFLKYRSFHKELDQDFHDFEHEDDDDFDGSLPHESEAASRTYVTLGEKKEEIKEAAKDVAQVAADAADEVSRQAADAAGQATGAAKEAAQVVAEDAVDAVKEAAQDATDEAKKAAEETASTDSATIEEDL
jgi:DNA-directed RNA polymerase subunit L